MLILFSVRLVFLLCFKVTPNLILKDETINNKKVIIILSIITNIIILIIFCIVNKIKKLKLIIFYDS